MNMDNCRIDDCQKRLLVAALEQIQRIVHTPTKDTMFRGAYQHFQYDFDRIRAICKDALASG